jgi:hypothetical protein
VRGSDQFSSSPAAQACFLGLYTSNHELKSVQCALQMWDARQGQLPFLALSRQESTLPGRQARSRAGSTLLGRKARSPTNKLHCQHKLVRGAQSPRALPAMMAASVTAG